MPNCPPPFTVEDGYGHMTRNPAPRNDLELRTTSARGRAPGAPRASPAQKGLRITNSVAATAEMSSSKASTPTGPGLLRRPPATALARAPMT